MKSLKENLREIIELIVWIIIAVSAIGLFLLVCMLLIYLKEIVKIVILIFAGIGVFSLMDKNKNYVTQKISDGWLYLKKRIAFFTDKILNL